MEIWAELRHPCAAHEIDVVCPALPFLSLAVAVHLTKVAGFAASKATEKMGEVTIVASVRCLDYEKATIPHSRQVSDPS